MDGGYRLQPTELLLEDSIKYSMIWFDLERCTFAPTDREVNCSQISAVLFDNA